MYQFFESNLVKEIQALCDSFLFCYFIDLAKIYRSMLTYLLC